MPDAEFTYSKTLKFGMPDAGRIYSKTLIFRDAPKESFGPDAGTYLFKVADVRAAGLPNGENFE